MHDILNYELLRTANSVITVGNVVFALIILLGARLLLKFLAMLLRRSLRARDVHASRQSSFIQLLEYVVWTFGTVLAIQSLGVDITFLIASSAALMVGVGLGLQHVFKDFVSGIIILMDGTVRVGDVMEVAGRLVKVREVSFRTSQVLTRDDNIVLIPNHKFIEEEVVNWTLNAMPSRFDLSVGVDYSSNVRLVEQILIECALQHKDVLNEPGHVPFVRFTNFGSSSLDFQLVFWSNNLFRIETTRSQLRFAIIDAFQQQGISIPFNQVVVHKAPEAAEIKSDTP